MSIVGPWQGPILEGWSVLVGLGRRHRARDARAHGRRQHVPQPGPDGEARDTLDHQSDGRAILGIGGAWFEREHDAFGIDFGSGFGERLDRLDESVVLMRRLLDGERFTHDGPIYPMHDALVAPRPIQPQLPIMIGGSGPKKTLRTLARYGDQWNTSGSLEELRRRTRRCASAARRSAATRRRSRRPSSFDIILRDTPRGGAGRATRRSRRSAGSTADLDDAPHVGTPEQVADGLRPIVELGFRHLLIDLPAPYDAETIDRIGEVLELLNA